MHAGLPGSRSTWRRKANAAYQYELGSLDTFVQTAYWNGDYKGLQAGESLLLDLRRMEASYLDENTRELELTKQISLALTAAREPGRSSAGDGELAR